MQYRGYVRVATPTDAGEDEEDHEGVEHGHDGQGQRRENLGENGIRLSTWKEDGRKKKDRRRKKEGSEGQKWTARRGSMRELSD